MSKWEPGARAVIMVSEWPENAGRVVTLVEVMERKYWKHDTIQSGMPMWCVRDGSTFKGWGIYESGLADGSIVEHENLCIAQWKLRLLDESEPVFEDASTGIEYASIGV